MVLDAFCISALHEYEYDDDSFFWIHLPICLFFSCTLHLACYDRLCDVAQLLAMDWLVLTILSSSISWATRLSVNILHPFRENHTVCCSSFICFPLFTVCCPSFSDSLSTLSYDVMTTILRIPIYLSLPLLFVFCFRFFVVNVVDDYTLLLDRYRLLLCLATVHEIWSEFCTMIINDYFRADRWPIIKEKLLGFNISLVVYRFSTRACHHQKLDARKLGSTPSQGVEVLDWVDFFFFFLFQIFGIYGFIGWGTVQCTSNVWAGCFLRLYIVVKKQVNLNLISIIFGWLT